MYISGGMIISRGALTKLFHPYIENGPRHCLRVSAICAFHLGFSLGLQRRVLRKHARVYFFSYGPFIMGDSHSFVASFKIRPRATLWDNASL